MGLRRAARRLRDAGRRYAKLAVNPLRLARLRRQTGLRVHLGCGDDRKAGWLNVDARPTRAADAVLDLTEPRAFAPGSAAAVYSHAFFEHLRRDARPRHLAAVRRLLAPGGFACCVGLPYFPAIARLYLAGAPGVVGPAFDLFEVYRYTHGDPEQVPDWWLGQLHKSLFDGPELDALLSGAGFPSWVTFTYCYVSEPAHPINCGFYATAEPTPREKLRGACAAFLAAEAADKVRAGTVEFLRTPTAP